ncbi:MAG: helix-turn-helix domain-containing protein, partial [Blautia sp.]
IVAEAYNILIFTINCNEDFSGQREGYSSWEAESLEMLENFFAGHPFAMLFRSNIFSYAVLIKGDKENIEENTRLCIEELRKILNRRGDRRQWFVAAGQLVERLSQIQKSYHSASRAFSQRYLYDENILYYNEMESMEKQAGDGNAYLQKVDVNALNPAILQKFLSNGLLEETENFVKDYFRAIGQEPLESLVFRSYVTLNVRFSVISFLKELGCDTGILESENSEETLTESGKSLESAVAYAEKVISQALTLRDQNSGNKNKSILKSAIDFIDSNYMEEDISLNKAANAANVSANHFSALFSQNMGQTFIEYLTSLRMNKAKEYLRCTGMRSSEIAGRVGYKDAHYFSYLFKKTQGMTPSDYRKAREEQS